MHVALCVHGDPHRRRRRAVRAGPLAEHVGAPAPVRRPRAGRSTPAGALSRALPHRAEAHHVISPTGRDCDAHVHDRAELAAGLGCADEPVGAQTNASRSSSSRHRWKPGAGCEPGYVASPSMSSGVSPASAIARRHASIVSSRPVRPSRRPTCDWPMPVMTARPSSGFCRVAALTGAPLRLWSCLRRSGCTRERSARTRWFARCARSPAHPYDCGHVCIVPGAPVSASPVLDDSLAALAHWCTLTVVVVFASFWVHP